MPAHVPAAALPYFANPLLLMQVRGQMETAFARFPGGTALLQTLFDHVRASLASGLHLIFVSSAVIEGEAGVSRADDAWPRSGFHLSALKRAGVVFSKNFLTIVS